MPGWATAPSLKTFSGAPALSVKTQNLENGQMYDVCTPWDLIFKKTCKVDKHQTAMIVYRQPSQPGKAKKASRTGIKDPVQRLPQSDIDFTYTDFDISDFSFGGEGQGSYSTT